MSGVHQRTPFPGVGGRCSFFLRWAPRTPTVGLALAGVVAVGVVAVDVPATAVLGVVVLACEPAAPEAPTTPSAVGVLVAEGGVGSTETHPASGPR
jgi:hypothetical protein